MLFEESSEPFEGHYAVAALAFMILPRSTWEGGSAGGLLLTAGGPWMFQPATLRQVALLPLARVHQYNVIVPWGVSSRNGQGVPSIRSGAWSTHKRDTELALLPVGVLFQPRITLVRRHVDIGRFHWHRFRSAPRPCSVPGVCLSCERGARVDGSGRSGGDHRSILAVQRMF